MLNKLNQIWLKLLVQFQNVFLLIIRLYWGYAFFQTGLGKFNNWDRTVGYFTSLNIPFPSINLFFAASIELVGGILLVLGLFSRYSNLFLISTMLVAYLTAHKTEFLEIFQNPDNFISAPPFLFLYTSIIVLLFGAGKFSLDYLFRKK